MKRSQCRLPWRPECIPALQRRSHLHIWKRGKKRRTTAWQNCSMATQPCGWRSDERIEWRVRFPLERKWNINRHLLLYVHRNFMRRLTCLNFNTRRRGGAVTAAEAHREWIHSAVRTLSAMFDASSAGTSGRRADEQSSAELNRRYNTIYLDSKWCSSHFLLFLFSLCFLSPLVRIFPLASVFIPEWHRTMEIARCSCSCGAVAKCKPQCFILCLPLK